MIDRSAKDRRPILQLHLHSRAGSDTIPAGEVMMQRYHLGHEGAIVAEGGGQSGRRIVRYQRTVNATVPRAREAVETTVALLGYPRRADDPMSVAVRFCAVAHTLAATVMARDARQCVVAVEVAWPPLNPTGASAVVILPGLLLAAALRACDAWVARDFLRNVQRVLEGGSVRRSLSGVKVLRSRFVPTETMPANGAEAGNDGVFLAHHSASSASEKTLS